MNMLDVGGVLILESRVWLFSVRIPKPTVFYLIQIGCDGGFIDCTMWYYYSPHLPHKAFKLNSRSLC